jgi:poly(A) polymerase
MIKRFIARLLGKSGTPRLKRIPVNRHGLTRAQIAPCALKVTDTLQQHGYLAFIVGGAVRDLLLAKPPKDFDVATNATPEQVHALFRRSHLIGRRFRLVHVLCGNETIEVSTFRASANAEGNPANEIPDEVLETEAGREAGLTNADALSAPPLDDEPIQPSSRARRTRRKPEHSHTQTTDETGRIVRDNIFGSQASDAARRDFTVNALYYDPSSEEILDYCGGLEDIRNKTMRIIGDAATRYREDPVRMLRAARFAAKLDFSIDPAARAPIPELADLLENVPSARLFDEMLKLLLSGHAVRAIHQLRAEGLHQGVLPMLDTMLENELSHRFVMAALNNTDQRIQTGKTVSPAFLFASLLWHEVKAQHGRRCEAGEDSTPAMYNAMHDALDQQRERLAIPRRLDGTMKEIWAIQVRFNQRTGVRALRLLAHPRFRAGYDFLLLRAEAGEIEQNLAEWWTQFQTADDMLRTEMIENLAPLPQKKRRKRKKPVNTTAPGATDA